jgi:hypothetical protein
MAIDEKYVVMTFDEEDLLERIDEPLCKYLEEHDMLLDEVVKDAVGWLRDYYDKPGDVYWAAIKWALERHIDKDKLAELESEERTCVVCGERVTAGMTDGDKFYCHEGCFDDAMYGEFEIWRQVEDDGCGGYYEWYDTRESKWEPTGIYYTEWED